MKIEKFWEKPGGKIRRGYWAWIITDRYRDHSENKTWQVSGYGESLAEAKADLLCQKLRCDMKHSKPHKPLNVWSI